VGQLGQDANLLQQRILQRQQQQQLVLLLKDTEVH
jgi:hypothetical protein